MKIALCIPVYGMTHAKFTNSLAALIAHTMKATLRDEEGEKIPVEIETFMVSSSMLVESRHRLVGEAIRWGADYMLWLDADHTFPHDAFCRLWSHNLPIVGCNYPRRHTPTAPTAAKIDGGLLYTTEEKAVEGLVEPCAHMGFGVCLINMKVFDHLQAHIEGKGETSFLPLFEMRGELEKGGMQGEDVFFFAKLRDAGLTPFIDHGLSWEIGHLHEIILTNAHAVSQQDRWDEFWQRRADKFADAAEEAEKAAA